VLLNGVEIARYRLTAAQLSRALDRVNTALPRSSNGAELDSS